MKTVYFGCLMMGLFVGPQALAVPDFYACQALLRDFDSHDPQAFRPERLGTSSDPVYRVKLNEDHSAVLWPDYDRLTSYYQAFVTKLFYKAPDLLVTPVRILEPSARLWELLGHLHTPPAPVPFTAADEDADPSLLTMEATGQPASEYLEERYALSLRRQLVELPKLLKEATTQEEKEELIADFFEEFDKVLHDPQALVSVREDLNRLLPADAQLNDNDFRPLISYFASVPDLDQDEWRTLQDTAILTRLPFLAQTDLANQWALAFVVGRNDFTLDRWVVHGPNSPDPRILSVPSPVLPDAYMAGNADFIMANPFTRHEPLNPVLSLNLARRITTGMKRYLTELSDAQIREIMDHTSFIPSSREMRGLLDRAHSFDAF